MQKYTVLILSVVLFVTFLILSSQNVLAHSLSYVWPSVKPVQTYAHPARAVRRKPSVTPTPSISPKSTSTSTPTPSKVIISPTPTLTRRITPFPTLLPSATSVLTHQVSPTPTQSSQQVSLSAVQTYILNGINAYRESKGLSFVSADSYTCSFAAVRAQEITTSFTHDGFTNRINSHTLPYPSYHEVTENIAMTSDYQQVVPMWIASPGHAENMQKDTPYVCVAQSGNYFAYEGWKP